MFSIDPYGLLGVTIGSTPAEVKQAYYALSLLVHPDKGGRSDDMIMVHNAYKYVIAQVREVNHTQTLEDLEESFATFCAVQSNEPPTILEINTDAESMREFHRAFEMLPSFASDARDASTLDPSSYHEPMMAMHSSVPHGYADYMDSSEYHAEAGDCPDHIDFETEIVTYEEPATSTTDTTLTYSDVEPREMLGDYGTTHPIPMTDYRVAFTKSRDPVFFLDAHDLIPTHTYTDLVCMHNSIPA